MDQNYANANAFFSVTKNSRVCQIWPVLKMWWVILLLFSKPELLLPKVGSNLKIFVSGIAKKNRYAVNFEFFAYIFNHHGPNWYVLRMIQWQNYYDKLKISDSVDFEQP